MQKEKKKKKKSSLELQESLLVAKVIFNCVSGA